MASEVDARRAGLLPAGRLKGGRRWSSLAALATDLSVLAIAALCGFWLAQYVVVEALRLFIFGETE